MKSFHANMLEKNRVHKEYKPRKPKTSDEQIEKVVRVRSYICYICNTGFTKRRMKEKHLDEEHAEYCHKECPYCPRKRLKNTRSYELHMMSHAVGLQNLGHTCSYCGKQFALSQRLNSHIKTVHEVKMVTCDLCGEMMSRYKIRKHVMAHTGLLTVYCHLCTKSFTAQKALEQHLFKKHGAPPKYNCQYCGKGFSDVAFWNHHEKWRKCKTKKTQQNQSYAEYTSYNQ
jgi:uncharacterized Zn-finger protein